MNRSQLIKSAKKVVIKVGTKVITDSEGRLDILQIERLSNNIADLLERGLQIIIVTSGAIGAGMALLGLKHRPGGLSQLQACAAIGQHHLMQRYSEAFRKRRFLSAQILLTAEDLRSRTRFLNARNTIFTLLDKGIIPIVNENDTVAVSEIKFGDNDRLSALVTNLVEADLLLILSDVDGLYDDKGKLVEEVARITKEIEGWCRGKGGMLGTGGMSTKLEAVRIVTRTGECAVIANGRKDNVIADIFSGKPVGTFFMPMEKEFSGKKRWLAFFTKPHGSIVVDKGAYEALTAKGKSLLAAGIIEVKGNFRAGDVVKLQDPAGNSFAHGLTNYTSDEINKIKGIKTGQLHTYLGYKSRDEVIHRNNIVIL